MAERAVRVSLHFQWNPQLRDPGDEHVLATAINGAADAIVTHNSTDFLRAASNFGIQVIAPGRIMRKRFFTMSAINSIPVSEELYREVARRAEETRVTPQDWATSVLSAGVHAEKLTDKFFETRVAGASSKSLGQLLDKAPNRPPDAGDEL